MTWMEAIGWLGNACYFSRFLVQWLLSERAGRSVAPRAFWWLSVGGAILLGSYAVVLGDLPLSLGYGLTLIIYLRNVSIAYLGPKAGQLSQRPALLLAGLSGLAFLALALKSLADGTADALWSGIAFLGQSLFGSRFVVQWYASEQSGDAHFPASFWWLSLSGNLLLLAYVCERGDPIFIAGFLPGPLVQARNLWLLRGSSGG
jgi:lipid-A-disaccharide synthase-like uncharacterized protein